MPHLCFTPIHQGVTSNYCFTEAISYNVVRLVPYIAATFADHVGACSLLPQQWIRAVIWVFHEIRIFYLTQGSQPLWKSGKTLKMSFQFSSQGKLREFGKTPKIRENSGNL